MNAASALYPVADRERSISLGVHDGGWLSTSMVTGPDQRPPVKGAGASSLRYVSSPFRPRDLAAHRASRSFKLTP